MAKGYDLSELYDLRRGFTIIALTGRTGSGCTTVAGLMKKGFDVADYPPLEDLSLDLNTSKKYNIIYKFAKENFKPYILIPYLKILTLCLLNRDFKYFISFLSSEKLKKSILEFNSKIGEKRNWIDDDFMQIIEYFKKNQRFQNCFDEFNKKINKIDFKNPKKGTSLEVLYDIFFDKDFTYIYDEIQSNFKKRATSQHNYIFQIVSNNLRKSGDPYDTTSYDPKYVFTIALRLNALIKAIQHHNKEKNIDTTKVVIDSLRNPFEVMFFKQRFSAFYLIAVNKNEDSRESDLKKDYKDYNKLQALLDQEYIGGKGKFFYKQYVRDCLEKADIHISFCSEEEIKSKNLNRETDKIPIVTWQMQLIKYLSLIDHPGIITPSPEERSMQMAYSAKFNSGCISRQVGAAITDENFSIKAVGWNSTPEGQVPCLLRNSDELTKFYQSDSRVVNDSTLESFTDFEKTNLKFKDILIKEFSPNREKNNHFLKGRNVCFCFKTLHNACYDGRNQAQTRSLHAEENAFLQITKYGGNGIKGGKLFTTASPCELCSKKAYQLGIKVIHYIDPYPGISEKQILSAGSKRPEIRLFNGAIGSAYHWLYEPLMPYKDELSILLNLEIKDLAKKQEEEIIRLQRKVDKLKKNKE